MRLSCSSTVESEKLNDRLHALIRLILITANSLSIDVAEAAGLKMAKNKAKYPAGEGSG